MSSNVSKVLAVGAGLMAYNTWDHRNSFDFHEAQVEESSMYASDRLHHAQQAYYDGPDTTGMLWAKHAILDPANWHWLKRPIIYVKGFMNALWENAIPLGLGICSLTWAFNGSVTGLIGNTYKHTMGALGYLGKGLGATGKALWDVAKKVNWPKMPKLGPKETLAVAAVGGMALYYMALFTKVMTGQIKDDNYSLLDPVPLEEAMEPGGGH